MPPPTRARRSIADQLNSNDDEPAHRRLATRQSKGPELKRSYPEPPVSEADIAPIPKADNSARPERQSYLLQHIKQQVVKKHEKPVRDEYYENMKALGGGCKGAQPAHAGAWDRKSLEETARLELEAGLKAVQPAIAKEMKSYEDHIFSEYYLRTERAMETDGLSLKFTRAEVTEAHEKWVARRTSLGLPIDGDCDDLAAPEPVGRRDQDSDFITDGDSLTNTSEEEHLNAGDDEDDDPESETSEDASGSSFTVDGRESSESGS